MTVFPLKKQIVVRGKAYADIDLLACISAYVELLKLQNIPAEA
jgi:hypothetical protein